MLMRIKKLFLIVLNPYYLRALLRTGVAASIEHNRLFKYIHKVSYNTIVDVGANRGQFALISRCHYPDARIISFEPLSEPVESFTRLFAQDHKVTLHNMALGSAAQETEIHVSKHDDSSSLLPISQLQDSTFPGTAEKETRSVKVKRLDEIINKKDLLQPAFLKIDVQGFEIAVLQGCESMLSEFTCVYVECSFIELYKGQSLAHEVISFLEKSGFILSGVFNLSYTKQGFPIQGDFLFEKKP